MPAHRLVVIPTPAAGETRETSTSCEVFFVSEPGMGEPFIFNKHMLMCISDLPLVCAATLIGIHESTLSRLRKRMGLSKWPYMEVMRGDFMGTSREDIVAARQSLISDLKEVTLLANDCRVEHTLRILVSAEEKAKLFWNMSSWNMSSCNSTPVKKRKIEEGGGGVGCVPVEDVPVEDEPVQDVPVEDEPVQDEPVQDVPVMPVMPICWPLLTDQYNFDPLFEVEDVLELGPIGKI